jgi:hypothetical protein
MLTRVISSEGAGTRSRVEVRQESGLFPGVGAGNSNVSGEERERKGSAGGAGGERGGALADACNLLSLASSLFLFCSQASQRRRRRSHIHLSPSLAVCAARAVLAAARTRSPSARAFHPSSSRLVWCTFAPVLPRGRVCSYPRRLPPLRVFYVLHLGGCQFPVCIRSARLPSLPLLVDTSNCSVIVRRSVLVLVFAFFGQFTFGFGKKKSKKLFLVKRFCVRVSH